jgi:hypothetical protein
MNHGIPRHTFPGVSKNDSVKRYLNVYQAVPYTGMINFAIDSWQAAILARPSAQRNPRIHILSNLESTAVCMSDFIGNYIHLLSKPRFRRANQTEIPSLGVAGDLPSFSPLGLVGFRLSGSRSTAVLRCLCFFSGPCSPHCRVGDYCCHS